MTRTTFLRFGFSRQKKTRAVPVSLFLGRFSKSHLLSSSLQHFSYPRLGLFCWRSSDQSCRLHYRCLLQCGSCEGNNCPASVGRIVSISLSFCVFLSHRHTTAVVAQKVSVSARSTHVFQLSFLLKQQSAHDYRNGCF